MALRKLSGSIHLVFIKILKKMKTSQMNFRFM